MWLQPGSWLSGPWWLVAAMRPTLSLWWWFAHGWNINRRTDLTPHTGTPQHHVVGGVWWWCGGTLLGCRSTSSARMSLVGGSVRISWVGVWVVVVGYYLEHHYYRCELVMGGVGGLLFVNYIVDASIFERRAWMTSLGLLVCGVYF